MTDRRDTLGRFNLEGISVRMKGLMESVHSSLGDGEIPSRKLRGQTRDLNAVAVGVGMPKRRVKGP